MRRAAPLTRRGGGAAGARGSGGCPCGAGAPRVLARERVARIVGRREFWSLPLRITPAVLVPRPETETVVEAALAVVERDAAARIAAIGAGAGGLFLGVA